MLELDEPVNVWVFFKGPARNALACEAGGNLIEPWCFFWKNRKIKVEKINLVHTSKNGTDTFYHFSLSSGGNFYRLKFDSQSLKWFLEEVDEDYTPY